MKKTWKNISSYALVVLVSVGVSVGIYAYLDRNRVVEYAPMAHDYGPNFNQQGSLHLASITENGYPDFTEVAGRSVHGVVHIKSTSQAQSSRGRGQYVDPFEFFFGFGPRGGGGREQMQPQPVIGMGSGVIISEDGYIMTNNHVIDKATEIEVTLNDNSKYKAKLVGTDPDTDIALLKIEASKLIYIPFGNSDALKVGEWVLAIGNPLNLKSTVTSGIVSALGRGGIGGDGASIQSFIQTDAAINQGNSGGALINMKGELIGINTAIYSPNGNFTGYGFAVPVSIAGKVVADIKKYGTVQRAMLGVLMRDITVEKELNPEETKDIKVNYGAYISDFAESSPAKAAGIEKGDVIIAVNGEKVKTSGQLQEHINRYRPGDKIKITVSRDNKDKVIDVTLKNKEGTTEVVTSTDGISVVGAAFKEISKETMKQHGISSGIEVIGVDNNGRFHREGVKKGYIIQKINNQNISSVAELEAIIQKSANSKDKVVFLSGFYPTSGNKRYYVIPLD